MIRPAIRLALLFWLLTLLALGAALAAAPLIRPANMTMATVMGDCGPDCWHDIHLGDATADLQERLGVNLAFADCFNILSQDCGAQFNLKDTPLTESLQVIAARGMVKQVLARHPAITLGEALLSQGRADYVVYAVAQAKPGTALQFIGYFGYADNSLGLSVEIQCPAAYAELLRQPLSAISLQAPVSANTRTATYAELRRAFGVICRP